MESLTYIKNLRMSPKKLRFLVSDIKKYKPSEVLQILQYTPKKGAKIFYKAIKSAIATAKATLKVDDNLLKFKVLTVEEGQKQKRWRAGGRGTVAPFERKLAHIKIILMTEDKKETVKPKVEEKKIEKKEIKQKIKKVKKVSKSK